MSAQKSVLVLGSGLVSPPLIHYLVDHGFFVTVANRTLDHAKKITDGIGKNCEAIELDIETPQGVELLEKIAPKYDALVSMLPYLFHMIAARIAVKNKKHFFTTSYTTDAMRELDADAKKAGVVIINECGVDPGTDHMSAMRVIHKAKAAGGDVVSFTSYCGGLPAPDSNDNPFGYKFSWAPRGVLLASKNDAHFLKDGKDVSIPGKDLFDNYETIEIPNLGSFESYPNRNSKQYIDLYGIKNTKTMIRGTYRYKGWCPTIKKIADLGFLDLTPTSLEGKSFAELTATQVGSSDVNDLQNKVANFLKISRDDYRIKNMEWLGLFDASKKVPAKINTLLDALCHICKEKMVYKSGERDMILMKHDFVIDYPDRTEHLTCTLIDFGIKNGDSSMSRTVSFPVAIAIRLVLEGKIKLTGLQIPTIPELYNPILDELETLGIKFVDKVEKVEHKNK
jgi:saccharopine dehydrogenase (NADP+, L-glutamate forming)/spermidine synthase